MNKDGPIPAHIPKLGRCWLWTARVNSSGYGIISVRKKPLRAHRFGWQLAHRPDPGKKFLCHHCDNPRCVRDSHLFIGTPKQNLEDMVKKGRQNYGNRPKGEGCHLARLTENEVVKMRTEYANGRLTQAAIAAKYGMSQNGTHSILRRKTWKHV